MFHSEQLSELAAALAKFQASVKAIGKNKNVKFTGRNYSYADLPIILESIREPMEKSGLAITQILNQETIVTMLLHSSGQWLKSEVHCRNSNAKPQEYGSEITYLRRYALTALLGICAQDDDDGEAASSSEVKVIHKSGPSPLIPVGELEELNQLLSKMDQNFQSNVRKFLTNARAASIDQLPLEAFRTLRKTVLDRVNTLQLTESVDSL